jgi:uncharacterized protein (DUF58 family)
MDLNEVTKTIQELQIYSHRKVSEVFAGNYKSAFKGAGIEVKNIREYADGDEIKYIDWNTSARQGKLFVKEYQETRELTTFLLVDVSASMNFGSTRRLKKEVMLEAAAILLFSALKNNDAMGMVLYADKVEKYIPPKKGQAQLIRILREMILRLDNNTYKVADAEKALTFFNNVVKKQAITFMLSDELSERTGRAMQIAYTKHDFVFINIYDQFEREPDFEGLMQIEDAETGEQMLIDFSDKKLVSRYKIVQDEERKGVEGILKKYGIDLLNIETQADVYKELMVFFKKRQLRR